MCIHATTFMKAVSFLVLDLVLTLTFARSASLLSHLAQVARTSGSSTSSVGIVCAIPHRPVTFCAVKSASFSSFFHGALRTRLTLSSDFDRTSRKLRTHREDGPLTAFRPVRQDDAPCGEPEGCADEPSASAVALGLAVASTVVFATSSRDCVGVVVLLHVCLGTITVPSRVPAQPRSPCRRRVRRPPHCAPPLQWRPLFVRRVRVFPHQVPRGRCCRG
jgi:hypothetical protein